MPVKIRHTLYNIIGIVAQIAAVLLVIPVYVDHIGWLQYGVFMLLITLLNYARSMGRGIEDAVKRHCASIPDTHGNHVTPESSTSTSVHLSEQAVSHPYRRPDPIRELFWSAIVVATVFSVVMGGVMYGASDWLITHVFTLTIQNKHQALASMPYIVLGVTVFSMMNVINGLLQGMTYFAQFNLLRVAGFYLFQFVPALAVLAGVRDISTLFCIAVASAGVWLILSFIVLFRLRPSLASPRFNDVKNHIIRSLMHFGSWSSMAGAIVPFMYDVDKIIVSAFMSSAIVSVQSIVIRIYSKLFIVPEALSSVLYNQFSKDTEWNLHKQTIEKGIRVLLAVQVILIVTAVAIGKPLLSLWIGTQHGRIIYTLMLIMFLGSWVYGPAYVPREWLTASGRPDIYAKLYAIMVIPFILSMYFSIRYDGLVGAEVVMVLQLILDSCVAFVLTKTLRYFIRYWVWTIPATALAYASVWMDVSSDGSYVLRGAAVVMAVITGGFLYFPYWKNRASVTSL